MGKNIRKWPCLYVAANGPNKLLANSAIYHASAPAIKLDPYMLVRRMHLDLVVSNLVPFNSHYTVYSRMQFHEPCSPGWLNISYFSVSSSLAAWLSQFCFGYGNMQIMFSQYLSQINGLCWHWDGSSIADVLLLLYKVFGFFYYAQYCVSTCLNLQNRKQYLCGSWCFLEFHFQLSFECEKLSLGRWVVLDIGGFRWWPEIRMNL